MEPDEITREWRKRLKGQDHVIDSIVPYIIKFLVNLNRPGQPVGNFLLLGPTGTGKTRAVEALAEVLHGSADHVLKIDCGEFQMEHEVAKLIGAPPGYLGHRETHPLLSQQKINSVASDQCALSIVLLDEIEKAASSMWRLLLGVMDKASLRLGDNSNVKFDQTAIFMTSNIGAQELQNLINPNWGMGRSTVNAAEKFADGKSLGQLQKVGAGALNKKFPPEFPNRVDVVVTFRPLGHDTLLDITRSELDIILTHINERLGSGGFHIDAGHEVIEFLVAKGTSVKWGAREIKRTIDRELYNPIAYDFARKRIQNDDILHVKVDDNKLVWDVEHKSKPVSVAAALEHITKTGVVVEPTETLTVSCDSMINE